MKHNGFKLLAIRPLQGTSNDLIKSLEIGEIYRFYNEYSYTLDGEDNHITSINYTSIVPSNLYGRNICVSAIVGKNGSGKSSLLELFYYATLISNQKHVNADSKKIKWIDRPCCVEIIILNDQGNIEIINISHRYNNNETTVSSTTFKVERDNISNFKQFGNTVSKGVEFYFYSNVINYSIYGLNSTTLPWLEHIFHKNDGYQLPIVISPFKENGNYDINNEYLLMQSRAIFYSSILGKIELIDDIYIEDVHFKIQLDKILKIRELEKSTFGSLNEFISNSGISENEFNKLIFNEDLNLISLDSIRTNIPHVSFSEGDEKLACDDVSKKGLLSKIDFYKSLVYLYVFRKLFKISLNYKKYRKFLFLFSEKPSFDFHFVNESVSKDISNMDLSNQTEQHLKEQIFEAIMLELDLIANDFHVNLSQEDLFSIKLAFTNYYEVRHDMKSNIIDHLNSYEFDSNNILSNIEPTRKIIQELFTGREFRLFWFKTYIAELNNDTSHITFKLNQAKNYFSNNIFESIELDKSILSKDDKECTVEISINNDYLLSKNKIEDIPLAVFEHSIQVTKTDVKNFQKRSKLIKDEVLKPFSYTSLSSGEQHLMNSMLTIAYHIYNLLSVNEEFGLIKYKNINLIFDELELYLHPEYQRKYISNLINLLNRIGDATNHKEINYNILMVTHSPFILSDIPSENVLKLKNGKHEPIDNVNSFAANIYDLLKDEFFLEKGAIGAYVTSKIKKIVDKKVVDQDDIDFVNLIGDPFLKGVLKKQIEERVSETVIRKEINRLELLLKENDTNS